jgi:sugar phosphate isomerase/epimerase
MAFEGLPLARMIDEASRAELALEFSSGMPFDPAAEETFRTAKISRLAHNYFPAPEVPFVLNLASADPRIRQRSIEHCVRGLHLSAVVGAPFFSVHAGFSIEVLPEHLGTRLSSELAPARLDAWPLFISAIREILARTVDLPVGLLVENHVVSRENRAPNGTHALLCADACECLRLVEDVGDTRLGLLSDTGHWTVTAATLGFDRCEAVLATLPHTRCFHHSDNDARVDDNGPLDEDYWFLPFMVQARHAVHVLEVRACPAAELARMNDVLFRRHSS